MTRKSVLLLIFTVTLAYLLVTNGSAYSGSESGYHITLGILNEYTDTSSEDAYKMTFMVNPTTSGLSSTEGDLNFGLNIYSRGVGGAYSEDGFKLYVVPEQAFVSYTYAITANDPLLPYADTDVFDTGEGTYPSIPGTHNGTITPDTDLTVNQLSVYPCAGTGGHAEYVKIWQGAVTIVEESWTDYQGDWQNVMFSNSFTLHANQTYNYTIRTGSYPQIIHEPSWNAIGGVITCEEFIDLNGKRHEGWIPAIRLS